MDRFARLAGVAGALRGGSYMPTGHGVRFDAARVRGRYRNSGMAGGGSA